MKQIMLILILLFCVCVAAQKVDIDKNSIPISHTYFPESPALSPLKTYQARISEPAGFLSSHGLNRVILINNFVDVGGYKKLETGGEFIVDIIFDGLQYADNRKITNSTTDRAGKTTNSYSYKIVFYIPITIRILDAQQNAMTTFEIRNSRNLQEWNSSVYANSKDLDQKINDERNQAMKPVVSKYIETALRDLSIHLTKKYGFREEKDWVTFYELDSPHPKFTIYKKHTDLIENEFKSYKPGMNVTEARQRIQPTLDYFADLISKLNKNDKQQHKLLKHTLINLFQLHFYLDDYDGFKTYGDLYSKLEGDSEWEDSRLLTLEKLHKFMKAGGATSLYYVRDLTDIKPYSAIIPAREKGSAVQQPNEIPSTQEVDLSRFKRNPTDRVLNGVYIDKTHKQTSGYFVIATGDDDALIFAGSLANTHFIYFDEQGNPMTKPLEPKKLDSFTIDKRQFVVMDYKVPGTMGGKSPSIMEVLANYPSIKLFKYYPDIGGIEFNPDYTFIFLKPDESIISFNGKDMFWKKKARNYFASCRPILDEIDKLKFVSPNMNISRSWAEMYDKCKQ